MVLDSNIADLIGALEYIIGNQTYNPNSYNGWTGEEGCGFKYPVNYCKNKADLEARQLTKTKSRIKHLEPECVETMKYAFGSNHLYIGDGLVEVLEYLEDIYGIDFNKLEEKRIEMKNKALVEIENRLNDGEIIKVDAGTNKVGVDIPTGKYIISKMKENYSSLLIVGIYNAEGDLLNYVFASGDDNDNTTIVLENGCFTKSDKGYFLKKFM